MPDLNLRRCVGMHLAAELCDLAGRPQEADSLRRRACALKQKIRARLYDSSAGWFRVINYGGKTELRWTMQLFKALGWGDWALDREQEEALVRHLTEPREFLGEFGLHSLSKLDPAYDEFDIDNGGPGACVSFTPAVIERLYRNGHAREAGELFARIAWLADSLPYWGDSQRADIREYRQDTPLQNDVEGAAIAQAVIFGMFGIQVAADGSISIAPHLPPETRRIALDGIRLAGRCFSIACSSQEGVKVKVGARTLTAPLGETIVLPPR